MFTHDLEYFAHNRLCDEHETFFVDMVFHDASQSLRTLDAIFRIANHLPITGCAPLEKLYLEMPCLIGLIRDCHVGAIAIWPVRGPKWYNNR